MLAGNKSPALVNRILNCAEGEIGIPVIVAYELFIGAPIKPYDVLIAGQARARNLILVTNDTEEFLRVPDLRFEDWTQA